MAELPDDRVVSLFKLFGDVNFVKNTHLYKDGMHPNAEGQHLIAEAIYTHIFKWKIWSNINEYFDTIIITKINQYLDNMLKLI